MHKVAVVQAGSVPFDAEASVDKAIARLREAAGNGAELVVFPEAFIGGCPKGARSARPWACGPGGAGRSSSGTSTVRSPSMAPRSAGSPRRPMRWAASSAGRTTCRCCVRRCTPRASPSTARRRSTWTATMTHIALEGRTHVISACQYITKSEFPDGHPFDEELPYGETAIRGGSVIIAPPARCWPDRSMRRRRPSAPTSTRPRRPAVTSTSIRSATTPDRTSSSCG
jgi:hypothetical protein